MCLICSLHLASMDLPVCPMYTSPHSQGIRYTPGTFRLESSLMGLSMCIFFFFGMWMAYWFCLWWLVWLFAWQVIEPQAMLRSYFRAANKAVGCMVRQQAPGIVLSCLAFQASKLQ
jgi:hypothetical protein